MTCIYRVILGEVLEGSLEWNMHIRGRFYKRHDDGFYRITNDLIDFVNETTGVTLESDRFIFQTYLEFHSDHAFLMFKMKFL